MDSATATAAGAVAATPSNGRKHHKPSSSLGSLYEALADLDENQLEYLLQEMNHTGESNVPVSQAVSAFDSQSPSESLNTVRMSMLPPMPAPEPGLQRQLSKSQQGKLRLQTAFQRTPSLRQRQQPETRMSRQLSNSKPAQDTAIEVSKRGSVRRPPERQSSPLSPLSQKPGIIANPTPEPEIQLPKRGSVASTVRSRAPTTSRNPSAAYKRIPRPDFSLPDGITIPDLLQLLEVEFLSSSAQDVPSPISLSSPASAIVGHRSSSPFLSPSPSTSMSHSPVSPGGRTLRKHSSRLDMALAAERDASGIEEIGLGMLEPRGRATSSAGISAPITPTEPFSRGFGGDTPSPVVLEGIFDVLENR
ncbi:uncharacterized protein N0V89_000203 [Didymosphaeria variabile]|uniref:Uncharacterized protein n=1 Tax=Didymosphaeria variabile TaxID=1932322 RepID=A0A9W8XUP9_9PLEO|nr:uncharacterized protein N0V89_000203 [Didymosphaeria variabile]KAJ4359648.1 hypothetical protein N0V89_000203 [Didymosphaeria variabile]